MKRMTTHSLYLLVLTALFFTSCSKDESGSDVKIQSVVDYDGNLYHTDTIGTQVWMVENLKVTHYRNGDPVTYAEDSAKWLSLGSLSGAYCNLYNDVNNVTNYGRLYKWATIKDSRNICPAGWRIPTQADWDLLASNLGGYSAAGGKMKVAGTNYWKSPNTGANNSSGFSAYPSLGRGYHTHFAGKDEIGTFGGWWSLSDKDSDNCLVFVLSNESAALISTGEPKIDGLAIRCIKE